MQCYVHACLETDSNVEHSLCYFVFLQVDSNAAQPLLFLILIFLFFFDQPCYRTSIELVFSQNQTLQATCGGIGL